LAFVLAVPLKVLALNAAASALRVKKVLALALADAAKLQYTNSNI